MKEQEIKQTIQTLGPHMQQQKLKFYFIFKVKKPYLGRWLGDWSLEAQSCKQQLMQFHHLAAISLKFWMSTPSCQPISKIDNYGAATSWLLKFRILKWAPQATDQWSNLMITMQQHPEVLNFPMSIPSCRPIIEADNYKASAFYNEGKLAPQQVLPEVAFLHGAPPPRQDKNEDNSARVHFMGPRRSVHTKLKQMAKIKSRLLKKSPYSEEDHHRTSEH